MIGITAKQVKSVCSIDDMFNELSEIVRFFRHSAHSSALSRLSNRVTMTECILSYIMHNINYAGAVTTNLGL